MIDVSGLGRIDPSLPRVLAVREQDFLLFEVSWAGLELKQQAGEPVLVRTKEGSGFLIVIFAPQNLAEKAYYQKLLKQEDDSEVGPDGEIVPVDDPDESPDPPPIDALLSDDSRLVFQVPKGTTIPFTVAGILDAAGRLKMSVPANALPRERYVPAFMVPAEFLTAQAVAIRGHQSLAERLVTAGRLREKVRGSGPLVAESADAIDAVIESHLRAKPQARAKGTIGGLAVTDPRTSIGRAISALRRRRPKPALPATTETAIESPYRLLISPSDVGGWAHAADAVEHDGRTELWHSRLGVRVEKDEEVEVEERTDFQRVVRAVWARGMANMEDAHDPPSPSTFPFRMPLDDRDRHNIVHLSSNFAITSKSRRYNPQPVGVNRLLLTSLGSWMDFEGRWDPWPKGLSLEEWLHRATLGRDHYVRVVYQGFLACPGNRSTLVKITERMFVSDVPEENRKKWTYTDNPAYLIQRMFIVVREQEKVSDDHNLTFEGSKRFSNAMPIRSIRILDRQTPDLDEPADVTRFIPKVGGKPFEFTLVLTDIEGNQSTVKTPLMFVDKSVDDEPGDLTTALATYNADPAATVGFSGQRVAYAPAKGLDDTTFETKTIAFAATIPDGSLSQGPHFRPRIVAADLNIPAVRQLTGSGDPLHVEFEATYLEHGFTTGSPNKGELLLRCPTPVGLALSDRSDRTGGLASPSMNISGISRLLGPVAGTADKIVDGEFSPTDFFSGMTATLFGVIPLSEVIKGLTSLAGDLPKVPRFLGKTMDQVEGFLDDLARLQELIGSQPALWNLVKNQIADVLDPIESLFDGSAPDPQTALNQLETALNDLGSALTAVEGALDGGLALGAINEVKAIIGRAQSALAAVSDLVDLVETLVNGIELPRSVTARFEWRPELKNWPNDTDPIFEPTGGLVLAAEARASVKDGGGDFTVSASLEDFRLNMVAPTRFLELHFDKLQLLVRAGKKPEIDVVLNEGDGIAFKGVLEFVETLRNLIPLDAFSDPPAVTVDTEGIRADLSMGLPNVSVGVFSLENLALGGGFAVPFVGDPLSVYFRFNERENPALVSVSMFAGGFYFGITLDPGGVRILEAAIEFGANVSMDFGVASGGVSAMAGIYFKLELDDATLAGYFRVRGHVRALGIVTVSIELYLELSYEFATDKCVGRAELSISIELFLFETTVTISCEKKFAGSGSDPTFAETMGPYQLDPSDPSSPVIEPWEEYCAAFD